MVKGRLVYTDLLRIIAIFGVILIHAAANIMTSCQVTSSAWQAANAVSAVVRFAVPVFFMVSGVFFLNPEKDISGKRIFSKYIPRLVIALLFWGIAYEAYYVMDNSAQTGAFSLALMLDGVWNVICGKGHFHLYFIYLIIGLYIICPILRVFTKNATRRQIEYFLLLFFIISGVMPLVMRFTQFSEFELVFRQMDIRMVCGYAGYFLAGYYFNTYSVDKRIRCVIYCLGIAATAASAIGTAQMSATAGMVDATLYEGLSPLIMVMSAAVFLFIKNLRLCAKATDVAVRKIAWVSKTTFGIYLMHDFCNILIKRFGIQLQDFGTAPALVIYALVVFLICMIISGILLKIPVVKKYIV